MFRLFFLSLCMCDVCECACLGVCLDMGVRGQNGASLYFPPLYSLKQGLSLNLGLTNLTSLASGKPLGSPR